jgi:hypothetical protein
MKRQPLLEEVRIKLEAAVFWAEQDAIKTQDLADEALALVNEAIAQIQGAREDAARMAGLVKLDTEILDLLAPDELTFPQLLALHPALEKAFYRLELMDANGASATASDIQDAIVYGCLSAADAAGFTDDINAACDMLERGEE